MSRARHHKKEHEGHHGHHEGHEHHKKHRAAGGKVEMRNAEHSNVMKEAKKGENIGTIGGVTGKVRMDHGGRVHHHKKHRATGGKVGADTHPFSSAHKDGGHVGKY